MDDLVKNNNDISSVVIDTYTEEIWNPEQEEILWAAPIHKFGVRQNEYNRNLIERLRAVESKNRQLSSAYDRILRENREIKEQNERLLNRIKTEEKKNREIFGRIAAEFDNMQQEINRVRLSAHLNGKSIERIINERENEIKNKTEDNKDNDKIVEITKI